jgi:hypothetical protein
MLPERSAVLARANERTNEHPDESFSAPYGSFPETLQTFDENNQRPVDRGFDSRLQLAMVPRVSPVLQS